VFGSSSFRISTISIDLVAIGKEYTTSIAQIAAPTLSSLHLCFYDRDAPIDGVDPLICYEIMEIFFSRCLWIRNLRLERGGFGDDLDAIPPSIKEGFSRLNQLDLVECYDKTRSV
jgi:hypothetical protein